MKIYGSQDYLYWGPVYRLDYLACRAEKDLINPTKYVKEELMCIMHK
jgi:hypothetical protein